MTYTEIIQMFYIYKSIRYKSPLTCPGSSNAAETKSTSSGQQGAWGKAADVKACGSSSSPCQRHRLHSAQAEIDQYSVGLAIMALQSLRDS